MINVKKVILTSLPAGLLFLLKKAHYPQALKAFSEKDESDLKVVKRLVKEGDHVVDIGANVGWYTKTLSELVGDQGQVFSIEPIPQTFELLSFCVRKLKLSNVKLLNCGISESDSKSVMHVPKYK